MSEAADWVAAHDQLRSEVIHVLDQRLPFLLCWIEEDENGEPQKVATTGLCREEDDLLFIMAILKRKQSGKIVTGPRPGEEPYE